VDRLYKKAVDTVAQKEQREMFKVMTDSGRTFEGKIGQSNTEKTEERV
jgi:hypothetical protein